MLYWANGNVSWLQQVERNLKYLNKLYLVINQNITEMLSEKLFNVKVIQIT